MAYYPVVREAALSLCEPIMWEGGVMQELPKKTVSCDVESFRGLLISDDLGKRYHKIIRNKCIPHISTYMLSSMYGEFMRRGVDFASLHIKAISGFAKHHNYSMGVLYVDVIAASESVIRELVLSKRMSDKAVVQALERLNFKPLAFDEFRRTCLAPAAVQEAGLPPEISAVLESVLKRNWFLSP